MRANFLKPIFAVKHTFFMRIELPECKMKLQFANKLQNNIKQDSYKCFYQFNIFHTFFNLESIYS